MWEIKCYLQKNRPRKPELKYSQLLCWLSCLHIFIFSLKLSNLLSGNQSQVSPPFWSSALPGCVSSFILVCFSPHLFNQNEHSQRTTFCFISFHCTILFVLSTSTLCFTNLKPQSVFKINESVELNCPQYFSTNSFCFNILFPHLYIHMLPAFSMRSLRLGLSCLDFGLKKKKKHKNKQKPWQGVFVVRYHNVKERK